MRCLTCGKDVVQLAEKWLGYTMYRCPGCEDMWYEDPPGVLRSTSERPLSKK
jgi:hypothetical protein